jgi:CheY-like chemotaxis protein
MPSGAEPELPLVLIVEDANFNLHAERMTLESFDYRVINTEEGASAILLAKLHRPDLVLLDLGLPDMNGVTVLKSLKADKVTRSIPVIVCTADDREETAHACRDAGCTDLLLKPFSSEQLLEAVGRVLAATQDGAPSPPAGAA